MADEYAQGNRQVLECGGAPPLSRAGEPSERPVDLLRKFSLRAKAAQQRRTPKPSARANIVPRISTTSRLLPALLTLLFVAASPAADPRMIWLDNGIIRLGADLDIGGAITWLSRSGDQVNLINSSDWGRQVQMSFYSGPVPFSVGDKHPAPEWVHLGWNPIQSGDAFGHRSRVLETRNDGKLLYMKCVPMQWPLDDVPGECTMESWLELDGPAVRARGRLLNARADRTQYRACLQELPAVYTNGPWHRLFTYSGAHPFTGEPPVELAPQPPPRWANWLATEHWSALVDDHGWGLGVWNPGAIEFGGGYNGRPGLGGAHDPDCGYLAPERADVIDHDIDYTFRYELILGTIAEIRARVYAVSAKPAAPRWDFTQDRQGWHGVNATDSGWRPADALEVKWDALDPQFISPVFFTRAEEAGTLILEAAFTTPDSTAQIFWRTLDANFSEAQSVRFPIQGDGLQLRYAVKLSDSPAWRGAILQLRLDPAERAGGSVRLRAIGLEK